MLSRHFSDDLADLARASERKRDSALLRATTELFALDQVHERDETRRYEELATHFVPRASVEDRRFVAERLAMVADAPASVIRQLARDVLDVAAPIIQKSPVLTPIEMLAVIAATGVDHHRLIAQRADLAEEVMRALRLTGDAEILARLDADGAGPAAAPSSQIDAPARGAPPPASPSERADPWYFLGLERKGRLSLIADLASRPPRQYASDATRLDRAFRTILGAAQIVGFARSGQLPAIIGAIAEGLGLHRSLVAAAVHDAGGELLAIMLKGLRLDDVQARQVFLLASPTGHDVKRFFPLADLYAGMEPSVAETLIAAWRDSASAGPAQHAPHMAENGTRRGLGVAAQRPSDQHQEQARRA